MNWPLSTHCQSKPFGYCLAQELFNRLARGLFKYRSRVFLQTEHLEARTDATVFAYKPWCHFGNLGDEGKGF